MDLAVSTAVSIFNQSAIYYLLVIWGDIEISIFIQEKFRKCPAHHIACAIR